MANSCDPEETRAIAIAGMSLAYALVGMLKRKGVLDPEAIGHTLEAALLGAENAFSADDRGAALARELLDLMGGLLAAHVKPLAATSVHADELGSSRTDGSALARRLSSPMTAPAVRHAFPGGRSRPSPTGAMTRKRVRR